ncbi:MAG: hypothetical protein ACRDS0_21685 [Pseudonocardiaceae bacterium]
MAVFMPVPPRGVSRCAASPTRNALAEQDILRPDVTTDEATHLLWLLASFDSFDQLCTGRSLPPEVVAQTLITTAERGLCR